ncbi:MAG: hypothetical protein ACYCWW_00135 [Deltaproteobacteria bacterium]
MKSFGAFVAGVLLPVVIVGLFVAGIWFAVTHWFRRGGAAVAVPAAVVAPPPPPSAAVSTVATDITAIGGIATGIGGLVGQFGGIFGGGAQTADDSGA